MQKRITTLVVMTAVSATAVLTLFLLLAAGPAAVVHADLAGQQSPGSVTESEYFTAILSGDQEVPPVNTEATGVARFTLVDTTTLNFEVAVRDIISITASHIHVGAVGVNGPVEFPLYLGVGVFDPNNPISGTLNVTEEQVEALRAGDYYVNVHTDAYPPGEIRGQIGPAQTTAYQTAMSPVKETAEIAGAASGRAFLTLSPDMTALYYRLLVADITDITAAHIHEAPPQENGGVIFTLYDGTGVFDPENPVSGMITPTISQVATMLAGDYYINVHTNAYPSGEIRGQVALFQPRLESHALLTGAQEVPPVPTGAVGVGRFQLSPDLSELTYYVAVDDITDITASHLHTAQPGQNGGVAHFIYDGTGLFEPGYPVSGVLSFDAQSVLELISGHYYVNVHTMHVPSGEIRGQVVGASPFGTQLSGDQEVPPVSSAAWGTAVLAVNEEATELHYRVLVKDIEDITAAHIHQAPVGENGPVIFPIFTGSGDFDEDNPASGTFGLEDENIFALLSGDYYINVHTAENPAGEIRGQLAPLAPDAHYQAQLTGDQEVPPVPTSATGEGDFTLDSVRNTLHYQIAVSDISDIIAAHIHLAPVGQDGGVIFGLFPGEGPFDTLNPIGSGVMLDAQNVVDLLTGYYYVNVHTMSYEAGEIRGQIGPVPKVIYLPVVLKD